MFSRQGRRLPWTDEGSMFEMVGGGRERQLRTKMCGI